MGLQGKCMEGRRGRDIKPFFVMEILEKAFELERAGRTVVHLEVGEPDFNTPDVIREAAVRALQDGHTHYTHSMGRIELREAIAEWHFQHYGTDIDPETIMVSPGSSSAMTVLFAALLNPGDEVLITDPGYACYGAFIRAFGGTPVAIKVHEEDQFQYPLEQTEDYIRRNREKIKAIIVNSPSNPTGVVTPAESLKELIECAGSDVLVVSDEIYHGLVYGTEAHSIREYSNNAVVINGFSKLFAMTGWRLGYAILPHELVRPSRTIQQNLVVSAPDFTQAAAITALRDASREVEAMRVEYDRRRKYTLARLRDMGLEIKAEPAGAFYIFFNVRNFTDSVYEFVFEILEDAGVALTPGIDFGSNGEGYLRLSYTNSMDNLKEGLNRLDRFFRARTAIK